MDERYDGTVNETSQMRKDEVSMILLEEALGLGKFIDTEHKVEVSRLRRVRA